MKRRHLAIASGLLALQAGCSKDAGTPAGTLRAADFRPTLPPAAAAELARAEGPSKPTTSPLERHRTDAIVCDVGVAIEWQALSFDGSRYLIGYRVDVTRPSPHTSIRDESAQEIATRAPKIADEEHRILLTCDERRWWGSIHDVLELDIRADGHSQRRGR